MSIAAPTLQAPPPLFPLLLPKPPQPHPTPLPRKRVYANLSAVRDLQREMDDLSDEENELEDLSIGIHNRGYTFLIPIGRSLTQQEEKNDADDDSEDSGSRHSGVLSSITDDGENESDLDASMEDLDDRTVETEDNRDLDEDLLNL